MILFPAGASQTLGNAIISIDDALFGVVIDGVKWRYTKFDGWGMGGGVEANLAPRPNRHGDLLGPTYRRARTVTIAGDVVASSRANAVAARDQLASLLADGSTGTLRVDDPDLGTRSVTVTLSDTPLSDDSAIGVGIFRWSLQFTAPDYRKYGEEQTGTCGLPSHGGGLDFPLDFPLDFGDPGDPGRVSVTNTGNAPSEPTFTVEPTLASGFEITRVETGQRLRYAAPVTSTLTLDCAAGMVLTDGQRRERYLTVRQWPSLLPGESATFQFSTLGSETPATTSASLSVSFSPAFS